MKLNFLHILILCFCFKGFGQIIIWENLSKEEIQSLHKLNEKIFCDESCSIFNQLINSNAKTPPRSLYCDDQSHRLIFQINPHQLKLFDWLFPVVDKSIDWQAIDKFFPSKTVFIIYDKFNRPAQYFNFLKKISQKRKIIIVSEKPS